MESIPEIDQQLISQLISSPDALDKFLTPVIKTLLSGNRVEQFTESVKKHYAQLSSQLPPIAKATYHDCMNLIKEYEETKQKLTKLHEQVKETHAQLSTEGKLFTAALFEEITSLKFQINVSRAKRLTEDALKVCLLAQEASLALLDRRYEESLAKLVQVQASLYTIEQLPEIVTKLSAWVDEQLTVIKEQTISGFKDWLAQLRQQSDAIGKVLMGQTRTKLDALSKLPPETPLLNHPELCISFMNIQLGEIPEIQVRDLMRIAHLFDLMGKGSDFTKIYSENRKLQSNVIIEAPLHAHKDLSGVGFNKLLEQVCGFCYAELMIRHLGIPDIPLFDNFIESTWQSFLSRIQSLELDFVRVASSGVMEQSALMNIKWSHVFFAFSIRSFAHNVHFPTLSLNDSLISLFYRYVEILKSDHAERISAVMLKSNFQESFVADVISVLASFLANFVAFLQGIHQINRELEDLGVKSIDSLLTESFIVFLSEHLNNLDLDQLITCSQCIHDLIIELPHKFPKERINSVSQLQTFAQTTLQNQIISQIQAKIDFIMRNAAIDFNPKDPLPSPLYLFSSLSKCLETICTALQGSSADMILFETCQHLSNRLMGFLLSERYHNTNIYFMAAFRNDLLLLQDQIVESFKNIKLLEHFNELDQTLELILGDKCHDYLDPIKRKELYPHIQPSNLATILVRIKEPEDRRHSFEDLALLLQ